MIETVLARSSKPVLTVPSTSTVREAAEFMASAGVRRLAVTEEGRVIGIFSAYHLVRILATGADPSSLRVSEAGLEVPAFLEPTVTLLEALGFTRYVEVVKTRYYIDLSDVQVTIDFVNDLGCFVEVESKDSDEASVTRALEEFGIRGEIIKETYAELMYRRRSGNLRST